MMSLSAYILLEPEFNARGRLLISRYLKVKDLIDAIHYRGAAQNGYG
jgi:hypothetical protein